MAEMAAFIASGKASGMTGTTINLTMGTPKRHQPSHKEVDRHVKEFSQTFGLRLTDGPSTIQHLSGGALVAQNRPDVLVLQSTFRHKCA
jgi:hypothetical protein